MHALERHPRLAPCDREHVVLTNLRFADRLAARYSGRGIPLQDLVQVARLGLVKAAHRFDPDTGADFLAYATPTILGELKRHFRDCGWAVRPPRRIQVLQARISGASSALAQSLGRTPTVAEIAKLLCARDEDVREARAAAGCFSPSSLDRTVESGAGAESAYGDGLGGEDPALSLAEDRMALAPLLRKLARRDQDVLRLRFRDGLSQAEIGRQVGVSQVEVSRTLSRVLKQVRRELVV